MDVDDYSIGLNADFHLTGSDRIGTKEDIPLVEIDVN